MISFQASPSHPLLLAIVRTRFLSKPHFVPSASKAVEEYENDIMNIDPGNLHKYEIQVTTYIG